MGLLESDIGRNKKPSFENKDLLVVFPVTGLLLMSAAGVFSDVSTDGLSRDIHRSGPQSGFAFCAADGALKWLVGSGDTLWAVANRHNTSVEEIQKINSLKSTTIHTGDILRLHGGCPWPVGGLDAANEYDGIALLTTLPKFVSLDGRSNIRERYTYKPWTEEMRSQVQNTLFAAVSIAKRAGIANWRIVQVMGGLQIYVIDDNYSYAKPGLRMLIAGKNSLAAAHELGHHFFLTDNMGFNEAYAQGFANYGDLILGFYDGLPKSTIDCGQLHQEGHISDEAWYRAAIPTWSEFEQKVLLSASIYPQESLVGRLAMSYARWVGNNPSREGKSMPVEALMQAIGTDYGIKIDVVKDIFSSFSAFDCQ